MKEFNLLKIYKNGVGYISIFLFVLTEIAISVVYLTVKNWEKYIILPWVLSIIALTFLASAFSIVPTIKYRKNIHWKDDINSTSDFAKEITRDFGLGIWKWIKNYFFKVAIISVVATIPLFFMVNSYDAKINSFISNHYILIFAFSMPIMYLPFSMWLIKNEEELNKYFDIFMLIVTSILIALNSYILMYGAFDQHDLSCFIIMILLFIIGTTILIVNEFRKMFKKKGINK